MARRLARRNLSARPQPCAAWLDSLGRQSSDRIMQPAVRLEFLRPREIEEAQAECATIFQPLGTIEWHGVHNVVGLDAVKAHALCVQAAQKAGDWSRALYGGVGGLDQPTRLSWSQKTACFPTCFGPGSSSFAEKWRGRVSRNHYPDGPLRRRPADRRPRDGGPHEPGAGIPVLGTPDSCLPSTSNTRATTPPGARPR